jgi:hypothetical protein
MLLRIAFMLTIGALAQLAQASPADDAVLQDKPIAYFTMGSPFRALWEPDQTRSGFRAVRHPRGGLPWTRMPNGDRASVLNGTNQYLEVASHPRLSVPTTGALTIEAWIRPDTLQFPSQEGSGYVHWAGKGEPNMQEYVLRMYSFSNNESRPNRISAYAFNLSGGLGSGSYFQDPVAQGEWIHVAAVINTKAISSTYPTGYVRIYKNGVLRDTTGLDQFGVVPGAGPAPLRIGTRDKRSYFKGAIGKFAIYDYEVPPSRLQAHVREVVQ